MKNRNRLLSELNISLERLKTFSCPEFKGVYSNQYFQDVIKTSINNYKNTYSVVFGDFNKLGIINDVYGHEFGDQALKFSIEIIKQSLPSNSIIVRAGGDEFYIIIPKCDKETADKYCDKIHNNLNRNLTLVGGLSIELASADSTSGNIDKLINITDIEVNNIKAAKKTGNSPADMISDDFLSLSKPNSISKDESKLWSELNKQVNVCAYNFLQNFRPSKTLNFNKEQVTDASSFITTNFAYLLSKKNETTLFKDETYKYLDEKNYHFKKNQNINNKTSDINTIDANTSELIHSLLNGNTKIDINSFSDSDLEQINSFINTLIENLIRDRTNLLSKQYFRLFLANQFVNSNKPLGASYISTCGIKLSNYAFDHSFTDDRLDKTNKIFLDAVKDVLKYNDKSFDNSVDDIHLISQGAGNYLFLYPKELSLDMNTKIKTIIDKVNSLSNIKDPDGTFKMAYYSTDESQTISKNTYSDFIEYIRKIKDEANYGKDSLKKQLFKSTDAFVAFKKSISNCINYYLENIPDSSKDINKMVIFINNVHKSFINQEVLHNNTRHSKRTTGIIKNDEEFCR
ncbi:MAG: GGDEF domain-containing protein [Clostridia bacterium]|nr:GGDEF domain-containing protein [Clostridia bacterium]